MRSITRERHYHVRAGSPDQQAYYGPAVIQGPFYDLVLTDLEEAVTLWLDLVDIHLPGFLEPEEQAEAVGDAMHLEMMSEPDEEYMGMFVDYGYYLEVQGCWGCKPRGYN